MRQIELALIYKMVYVAWMEAFKIKTGEDVTQSEVYVKKHSLLNSAYEHENKAVILLKKKIK